MIEEIKRLAEALGPVALATREHLHAHPELSLQETRTAALVQEKLQAFGVDEIVTGMARTGVVGVIRGRGESGRAIGLRADMDALPIHEETNLPYASRNPGVMHACGHDGHTAMLLGAAKYLAETRNFDGTVYLIFQPAEENLAGLRQQNGTGGSFKKPHVEFFLEVLDLRAQGRLGDVQSLGGAPKIQFLGHGHEIP